GGPLVAQVGRRPLPGARSALIDGGRTMRRPPSAPPGGTMDGSGLAAREPPMKDIVIIDGARTAFGTYGGALRDTSATDLGIIAAKGALEKSRVDPKQLDQVIFGNVLQTSGDAVYFARPIGPKSGRPKAAPALPVKRLCG